MNLNPKSIAIYGISSEGIGKTIYDNLKQNKKLKLYPINPHHEKIGKIKIYHKLPTKVDLAIIAVPKVHVFEAIKDAAEKETKNIYIISAGFGEINDKNSELKLKKLEKKYNLNIFGPNTLGFINNYKNINAIFLKQKLPKFDKISILSQSGTIGGVLLEEFRKNNLGINYFISYGNATCINESEILEFLIKDKNTKTIVAYIEEIKDGKKFFELVKKTKKKIIILKPGKNENSKKAMLSHTGALAEDNKVYEGIFKQLNIQHTNKISELINYIKATKIKNYKNVIIITNGGGYGILIAEHINAKLRKINAKLEFLPELASKNNPIDLIGDADIERYIKTLEALKNKNSLFIISILAQTPKINKNNVTKLINYIEQNNINAIFITTKTSLKKELAKKFIVFNYPEDVKVIK